MKDEIKAAFEGLKADSRIKTNTKEKVLSKLEKTSVRGFGVFRIVVPLATCMLIIALSGGVLYFTPTMCVSIDVNPSVELSLNSLDRVIGVRSFTDNDEELENIGDIKHMKCAEAIEVLMKSSEVSEALEEGGVLEMGVAGKDNAQSRRLMSDIRACTKDVANSRCYSVSPEELEKAHEAGLSCGKYRAFEELREVEPEVTPEEVRNMSMREIRDYIRKHNGSSAESDEGSESAETVMVQDYTNCDSEDECSDSGNGNKYRGNKHD